MSQRYRQAIREAVEETDVRLRQSGPQEQETHKKLLNELVSANVIWSLFEAVSFGPTGELPL